LRFFAFFFAWILVASMATAQETEVIVEPDGELTLERVLQLVTARSPEIAAAQSELRAREGRLLQAASWPNPELAGMSENLGGDIEKTGGVQSTLEFGQRLELGGDRRARTDVARAGRDLARWDLESRRRDVASRATTAFVDVLSGQKRVELASDTVRLAEQVLTTVAARVEAGKVSPIEETRAEVGLATERIERERAAAELAAARSRLSAIWGSTSTRFTRAVGTLGVIPAIPPVESIAAQIDRNPEVARWATEIVEREALLRMERARAVPDVTISAGYRRFELGNSAAVIAASVPLPLFDRNRGAQIEARERLARARNEQLATLVRFRQLAEETHAFLTRAEAEVRKLRDDVVPGAESVYAAISEGYRLGKFGYMEVLDARRTLVTARAQLVRAQSELQRSFADLLRLTSEPFNASNGEQQ
jgi:outer membrane protein, heavy metal efflux system